MDRIKSIALQKNETLASLERLAEFGQGTIRKWDINSPSGDKLLKVANLLDVSVDWLLTGEGEMHKSQSMTQNLAVEDMELLENYKKLSKSDQIRMLERIKTIVDLKAETETRILKKSRLVRFPSKPALTSAEARAELREQSEMQVFDLPTSAGFGNYLDQDSTYEMLSFDADEVPDQADYGIRISGDSMEPLIEDGSIVWVKEQLQIENGQIGIFIVDGEAYCKKLEVDYRKRKMRLISLNKKYPPIVISEDAVIKTVGRILI